MPSRRVPRQIRRVAVSTRFHSSKNRADTHDNAVIPGKDGKLTQASDEVPSSSDVASYEDAERENREWVHRSARLSLQVEHAGRCERTEQGRS